MHYKNCQQKAVACFLTKGTLSGVMYIFAGFKASLMIGHILRFTYT
jgi:hypothetical protein